MTSSNKPLLYLAEFDTPDAHHARRREGARRRLREVGRAHAVPGARHGPGDGHVRLAPRLDRAAVRSDRRVLGDRDDPVDERLDYPLVIGGKPPDAIASMVPIMFELTVLLSAFGAVLGMLGLNELPKHHHPIFYSDRFEAFSHDKFFVSIEAADKQFDTETGRASCSRALHPTHLELVAEAAS